MQNLRARPYDPANGRFIGLDPFAGNMQDPQSLHKYAYVHGDPVANVDSSGEFAVSLGGFLASVAIGGGIDAEYSRTVTGVGGDIIAGLMPNSAFAMNWQRFRTVQTIVSVTAIGVAGLYGAYRLGRLAYSSPLIRSAVSRYLSRLSSLTGPRAGKLVGAGVFKEVYELVGSGGQRAAAFALSDSADELRYEQALLNTLENMADFPVVKAYGVTDVGGRPALILDYYPDSILLKAFREVDENAVARLTSEGVDDLVKMRQFLLNNDITDFQILVSREGRAILIDPKDLRTGVSDVDNVAFLDDLISRASTT